MTATRHDLPNDAWVEFRDPADVPERLRRPITRLANNLSGTTLEEASEGNVSPGDLEVMFDLNDALVVALTTAWSFDQEVTAAGLGDLPGSAYDLLLKLAAPSVVALLPDFGPSPDPTSPTEPSPVSA